jgi:tetratricopeptide (TPR) repeat protein
MSPSSQPAPLQEHPSPPSGPDLGIPHLARTALELHQGGKLAEAELLYRRILALDPRHTDSLHLLGVLAHQVGQDAIAVELIGQAIALDPRQAAYHCNLGTALQALGRVAEAVVTYRRALTLQPALAQAKLNLGVSLQALGQIDEAEACFRQALKLRPEMAEIHINLGNILQQKGKLDEATASLRHALALRPHSAEAHFNLANTLQAQGRLEEAEMQYRQALDLNPSLAEAHGNLGNTLLAEDRPEEAVESYQRALALQPAYPEACYNLGNARMAQQRLEEAAACFRRAIELNPALPQAHYNLGNALHALDHLEEAAASYERALHVAPAYAQAAYNLGCILQQMGRLDEAIRRMEQALELQPDYPQARFGLALVRIQSGDLARGWQEYDSRWHSEDHESPWRTYAQPLWKGEALPAGRLLLWGEQGIGDEIQFAGLIPDALRTGNRIVLDCAPRLRPLFARSFPEIEVVSDFTLEDAARSDLAAHLPTGSLPGLFRSSASAFSAAQSPYLKAAPERCAEFRARYGNQGPLIGLAWQTRNARSGRRRSIGLEQLAPLFHLPGQRWVSLQYGAFDELEEQARAAQAPLLIDRSVDQFADIDLFAAQVAAMDLVVTIDNSTAHLAGALGRPTFLLLPLAADWRWFHKRTDTPWYPSLRLFRQTQPGEWDAVIRNASRALRDFALPQC